MEKVVTLVHTRFSRTGGVENYINKLVHGLLARNWQVHYVTGKIQREVPPKIVIHRVPIVRGTSFRRMLSFAYGAKKAVQKINVPVVVGFGRTIYQDLYRDGSGCLLDYEVLAHKRFGWLYKKAYLHLEGLRFADKRLKKIIAISQMVKNQIIDRYRLPPSMVEVLYNGVDPHSFFPESKTQKRDLKERLDISKDSFVILFIGNGYLRKGLDKLLHSVARITTSAPFTLLVAGKDRQERNYKRLARDLGCHDKVRFLGPQENLASLYRLADVFVLPSLFDAFGNVVLEALYSGTPAIVGPHVGANELITDGVNGYILPNCDPKTIARSIQRIYWCKDKKLMAEKAHVSAKPYVWENHMNKFERILLELH